MAPFFVIITANLCWTLKYVAASVSYSLKCTTFGSTRHAPVDIFEKSAQHSHKYCSYLQTSCVPPITHSNLKAANILLDEDLNPRICDCGLAVLKPLASNSVKIKASEMAIADGGYVAPEHVKHGNGNPKADVYSFGVLLLELLTGRRPFDSSKPKGEQSLVEWASFKLHDNESLLEMVDPTIKRIISTRSLSSYSDIVSQCIQPQKEFRPQMAEVVQSLVSLLQKSGEEKAKSGKDKATAEGAEVDPCERSFRSTNSRFFASPTASY